MVSFTFEFDRPDRKYKAGDTIHCQVIVTSTTKFKARSLSIRFKGYAHTEWEESHEEKRDDKTVTIYEKHTGDEEYFRSCQYFKGNQSSSSDQQVWEGTNVYNASFQLPNQLPSSYDGTYGYVKYDVKAKFDISWGFDKEDSAPFFVASQMDLNEFPYLREPVKGIEENTFGCCCCESEPMQLINILPKSGFAPGDTIPVTIQVDNGSDVRLESVRVKFKENITFTTRSPRTGTRTITNNINEHFFQTAVEPFQNKVFQTTFYLDPSFDWKVFNGCGIIDVSYYIKSEAVASGCHSNPDNTTGITIGTIPMIELPPINGHNGYQPIPVFNPTAPDEGHVIIEQPLPSYNEAARGPSPIAGASGGIGWNFGGLVSPSGAPMASTEKVFMDDTAPPSFEDSQKSPFLIPAGKYSKEIEAGALIPSAPAEHNPTAPPQ